MIRWPTIVLIHGAWHTAAHLKPLEDKLERHEFPILAITMPSPGTTDPNSECAYKIAAFFCTSLTEPLLAEHKQIILASHLYDGVPKIGAIDEDMSVGARTRKGLEMGFLWIDLHNILCFATSYLNLWKFRCSFR